MSKFRLSVGIKRIFKGKLITFAVSVNPALIINQGQCAGSSKQNMSIFFTRIAYQYILMFIWIITSTNVETFHDLHMKI